MFLTVCLPKKHKLIKTTTKFKQLKKTLITDKLKKQLQEIKKNKRKKSDLFY